MYMCCVCIHLKPHMRVCIHVRVYLYRQQNAADTPHRCICVMCVFETAHACVHTCVCTLIHVAECSRRTHMYVLHVNSMQPDVCIHIYVCLYREQNTVGAHMYMCCVYIHMQPDMCVCIHVCISIQGKMR